MTAVVPESDIDTDSISLLDFEHEIPCDWMADDAVPCPHAAEWIITLSCCGRKALYCQEHFDDVLEFIGIAAFSDRGRSGCGKSGILNPFLSAERLDKHKSL